MYIGRQDRDLQDLQPETRGELSSPYQLGMAIPTLPTWACILNVLFHYLAVCINTREVAANNSIRLYGGSSDKEGVVQVMVAERWKTICNDGWDVLDALVTCRELGFTEGYAMLFSYDYYEPPSSDAVFIIEGNDFACEGTEKSLLSCKYTKYSGYCWKLAGASCDITPQQFYEMLTQLNDYEPLTYSVGPNGNSTGRVLAVQRQQNTRVLVTGGVCNIDDRAAPMICGRQGYENGGKPTRMPHLNNLPMLATKMTCDYYTYWLGGCDLQYSTDGLCQDGAPSDGVECYTTLRPSVIGALAFAFVSAMLIIIFGSISIHWIRRGKVASGAHSILTESNDTNFYTNQSLPRS